MREMVIIGTTLAGRVAADAVQAAGDQLVGFLNTRTAPEEWPYPVLGEAGEAERFAGRGRGFIIAEENPAERERWVSRFPALDYSAVVHPAASVASDVRLGPGVYVGAGAVIGPGAVIGAHSVIGEGCIIGAMSHIGEYCELLARVNIGREVAVGDHTFIGHSATLKDQITIAAGTVIQTGEIVVKDMVMKMVFKRGAWIYKENGPDKR